MEPAQAPCGDAATSARRRRRGWPWPLRRRRPAGPPPPPPALPPLYPPPAPPAPLPTPPAQGAGGAVILVMGSSSAAGAAALAALRRDAPRGVEVLAATRSTPGAGERVLDIEYPESWGPALQGVTGLFMLCPPRMARAAGVPGIRASARAAPDKRVFGPFLAAAKAAGVRHAVFLSAQSRGPHGGRGGSSSCGRGGGGGRGRVGCLWGGGARCRARAPLGAPPHARVEAALRASGVDWTVVRSAYFMQNLLRRPLADAVRGGGRIELPAGASELNWADARDAGALAAHALLHPSDSADAVWEVASDRAGYARIAALLSDALGRQITYAPVGPLSFVAGLVRQGLPLRRALLAAALHVLPRAAPPPPLSNDAKRVLGRPAATLVSFIREHRARWARCGDEDAAAGGAPAESAPPERLRG